MAIKRIIKQESGGRYVISNQASALMYLNFILFVRALSATAVTEAQTRHESKISAEAIRAIAPKVRGKFIA